MKRPRDGFTLIELLVVVTVICILAATAIPKFSPVKQKAYRSQAIADLTSLRTAEESFFVDSNRYATVNELGNQFSKTNGVGFPTVTPGLSSWSATLTHPNVPGMICGVAVGMPNPVNTVAGEGEPFCQ
jgi:prepilin-type N-terminal cleavage/methylation domain-containing protein